MWLSLSSMTARRSCPMSRLVPSAQQSVGLLVGGSLPRRARLAEEHLDAERGFDVGPAGQFASLVPGEGARQPAGLAAQLSGPNPMIVTSQRTTPPSSSPATCSPAQRSPNSPLRAPRIRNSSHPDRDGSASQ